MSQTPHTQPVDFEEQTPIHPHHTGQLPEWTVAVGILLTGIFQIFLPERLTFGPNWLLLLLEVALLSPIWLLRISGKLLPYRFVRALSLIILGLITLALCLSVIDLIATLSTIKAGTVLLRTAGLLWLSNVLVFGLWYWEIDGGGPRKRHEAGHISVDLLFPQQANGQSWAPGFMDYLFVAFTAATAFSPTDTSPLTRTAKMLMMLQAMISLMILGILIGRVSNIL